jgi:hypothetical protein
MMARSRYPSQIEITRAVMAGVSLGYTVQSVSVSPDGTITVAFAQQPEVQDLAIDDYLSDENQVKRDRERAEAMRCLTVHDLCKRWKGQPEQIRAFIHSGELKAFKYDRAFRVKPEEAARFERARGLVDI